MKFIDIAKTDFTYEEETKDYWIDISKSVIDSNNVSTQFKNEEGSYSEIVCEIKYYDDKIRIGLNVPIDLRIIY